jgi:hypothetical protein
MNMTYSFLGFDKSVVAIRFLIDCDSYLYRLLVLVLKIDDLLSHNVRWKRNLCTPHIY